MFFYELYCWPRLCNQVYIVFSCRWPSIVLTLVSVQTEIIGKNIPVGTIISSPYSNAVSSIAITLPGPATKIENYFTLDGEANSLQLFWAAPVVTGFDSTFTYNVEYITSV